MNDRSVDDTGPSDPRWAGSFTDDYFSFVRHGRWHIHDADTGTLLAIIPVVGPFNDYTQDTETDQEDSQ